MIKKIVFGLSVIALVVLIWYVNDVEDKQRETDNVQAEKENQCRPYYVEKRKLEKQLEDLATEYERNKEHKATTQLLFTELDPQVYEICYPIMKKYEFAGMLAFSQTEYPGAEGCMSVEQFRELKDAGWTVCVKWDTSSDVSTWLPIVKQKVEELGAQLGQAVYFPIGTYNLTMDAKIQEQGFSIAVANEQDTDTIVRTADEDGVWHLGAVGFMSEKPKIWLNEAVSQKGNITYLIGFELEHEKYTESPFTSMLSYFEAYEGTNEIMVSSPEEARVHYQSRLKEQENALQQQYEQKRAELEAKLTEVTKKIEEIQNK